jgi:hypothetical protein
LIGSLRHGRSPFPESRYVRVGRRPHRPRLRRSGARSAHSQPNDAMVAKRTHTAKRSGVTAASRLPDGTGKV